MLLNVFKRGLWGQCVAGIVVCLSSLILGQVFSWSASAVPKIISGSAGFTLSNFEISQTIAISYVGNIIIPIPIGFFMDKYGRKNTMIWFCLIMFFSWIAIIFSKNFFGMLIGRLLAGLWTGMEITLIPVFICETVEPEFRGIFAALHNVFLHFGMLFESLLGFATYDMLCILSIIPTGLLFLSLLLVTETPYYFLMHGDKENAKESIIWLYGKCTEEKLNETENKVKEQMSMKINFMNLFKTKTNRRALYIVEILNIVRRGSGIAILAPYVTIFIPDSFISAQRSFIILCSIWLVMAIFSVFFIEKFSRRTLMCTACTGTAASWLGVSIWYYLRDKTEINTSNTEALPLVFILIGAIFYPVGIATVPNLMQGELFPVNVKGNGSAIASMTCALTSGVVTWIFFPLSQSVGIYLNFIICFVFSVFGAIFSITGMVETRGKSLEDIQEILQTKTIKKNVTKIPGT